LVYLGGEASPKIAYEVLYPKRHYHLAFARRSRGLQCVRLRYSCYLEAFKLGLRFPIPIFVFKILEFYNVYPCQLASNSWLVIMGFLCFCKMAGGAAQYRSVLVIFSTFKASRSIWVLVFREESTSVSHPV
ncbi:hypothetical protein CFOL_v3_26767, partial [Cephalotus follicularis]